MEDGEELAAAAAGDTARLHEGRRGDASDLLVVLVEGHKVLRLHSRTHSSAPQGRGLAAD
jgi:hypothetical protein